MQISNTTLNGSDSYCNTCDFTARLHRDPHKHVSQLYVYPTYSPDICPRAGMVAEHA